MADRIIAIGDVHGCHEELAQLLDKLSPDKSDTVVMLGDIINRGPDSHKALALCRGIGAVAVVGNHERRLLRAKTGASNRSLNAVDKATFKSLDNDDWAYLSGMHRYFHAEAQNTVLVHGGFIPGSSWREQSKSVVTQIQVIDKKGRAAKRSDAPAGCPHWSDFWQGPPFVVYGHTPWHEVHRTEWTMGIDTGCVYGGSLSALILPGREIVQVKSAQSYFRPPQSWRDEKNS